MSETLQEQLAQTKRNHIIQAAIAVVAEQGFQRTTIKQIAQKAGVADGTIYNYFQNKEAILMGIMAQFTEAEVRDIHFAEAEGVDFETFVREYIAQRMAEVSADFQALKVIMSETMVNEELSQRINEAFYTPGFEIAEQYFQHLMANGDMEAADSAVATRLFAAPLIGLMFLRLIGDEHITAHWDTYTQPLIEFMLKVYK
jgi:AcrR family transcriptional regulator